MRNKQQKLAIVISSILVALVGIIVKLVGDTLHPFTFTFYRLFIGTIFLFIVLPLIDQDFYKVRLKDFKLFAISGFFLAASISSFVYAVNLIDVSSAVLITSTYVFFVVLFAFLFLKEKLRHRQVLSMILILAGLMILNPLNLAGSFKGVLIAILNAIFHAALLVYMKFAGKNHRSSSIAWSLLFASILLAPSLLIFGTGEIISVIPHMMFVGGVLTAIPYTLLAFGLKDISTDTTAIIQLSITPVSAIIFAAVFLGEKLTEQTIMGGSLIVVGGITLIYSISKFKNFLSAHLHAHHQ